MPFLTRVPMSGQRWMGYMSLRITPMFMGHVSLGGLNEGHFHRGRCQAACCFGVRFQATCLLGSLGFWFLINSGLQTFQATFSDILSFRASSSSSSILHFCFCNFGHYSPFPTVSLFFPSLLQASLVSASGCLFQILVSPFFLYIGFFFFTIHLVVVGVVFGVCDFLGTKWTLRGPECRVLEFFQRRQSLLEERLVMFIRTRVFSCLFFVGPLKGIPRPLA